jgi:endonuclease/exonuclease/phosphatase family metal-dependent hydrolase
MSYNIHSCIGIDGKRFLGRIARVIRRQRPDIIALQEVDRNMARTGYEDQVRLLSRTLGMHHFYFPVLNDPDGGQYGLAVLSRYPAESAEYIHLPQQSLSSEKRGVMRVKIDSPKGPLHILNTHLSLFRRERIAQMEYIVDTLLPECIKESEPVIFCGDFNAGIHSPSYRLLTERLDDCQNIYPGFQPEGTFFSSYPFLRLDHIFHSHQLTPETLAVINDWECRLASDHLPVLTVLRDDRRKPA